MMKADKQLLIYIFTFSLLLLGAFTLFPKEIVAGSYWHREHTHTGAGIWKQTDNPYIPKNNLTGDEAAAIGRAGPHGWDLEGSYDNITFINLEPGRYRVRTNGEYGNQDDEHMVFETSDGNEVTLADLDGDDDPSFDSQRDGEGHVWLWGEKEIDVNQSDDGSVWIKIRAYDQEYPGTGSLLVNEVRVEFIGSLLPDITAQEPTLDSGALEGGGSVTFASDVTNQGTLDAIGTFDNEFQVDIGNTGSYTDPEDFILNVVSSMTDLLAGEVKQAVSSTWSNVPLGTYAVRLCADISTSDSDIASGLIGHWKFDETNNTTATDSSANNNNGTYEVSLWWTEYDSRCTSVPIEIYDGVTLLDTVNVNQQADGGQWNVIGTYDFSDTTKVEIISQGSCSTSADAVKFTPSGSEIIIDDGDPETTSTGTWSVSSGANPYGTSSLYANSSATYTFDSFTNGNDGIVVGSGDDPTWVTGNIDNALSFDGVDDIVRIDNSSGVGHPLDFTAGPFTIATWFKPDTTTGTILSKRDGNNIQYQFYISDNALNFRSGDEKGKGSTVLSADTWYHGIVVVDSSGNPELYLDGFKETWVNVLGSRPFVFTHQAVDVSIGARWNVDPAISYQFGGLIDGVRIYNKALTQEEVTELYTYIGVIGVINESDETNNCSSPFVFSVDPKPPLLSAMPNAINQGDSTTLTWTCYDSTTSSGFGGEGEFVTGGATDSFISVSPSNTVTYTVQCFNGGDDRGQASEEVVVLDVPTVNIEAESKLVRSGTSTIITWSATDVDTCTVTGPNGFYYTDLSGSESTGPITEESVYTIECQNIIDQASYSVKVTIIPKFYEI